jgi:hypothetical protein
MSFVVNKLLFVYVVAFASFQKGRDISENGEKVLDSRMQTQGLLHTAIQHLFTICKRVVDSLLKRFSQVVDTLLIGLACGLHY